MHTELDFDHKPTKDTQLRTAEQNKQEFMNSFSIKFQLPTVHILQKKIMELAPGYSIEIVKYVFPDQHEILSYSKERKKPKRMTSYKKQFGDIDKDIMLQLIKINGHQKTTWHLSKLKLNSII